MNRKLFAVAVIATPTLWLLAGPVSAASAAPNPCAGARANIVEPASNPKAVNGKAHSELAPGQAGHTGTDGGPTCDGGNGRSGDSPGHNKQPVFEAPS